MNQFKTKRIGINVALFISLITLISCSTKLLQQRNDLKFDDKLYFKETDSNDKRQFVIKMDGTLIPGNNIKLSRDGLLHFKIVIDGVSHKEKDIKAYKIKDGYFSRVGMGDFARCEFHGKVNIYIWKLSLDRNSPTHFYYYRYFIQKGDLGELKEIFGLTDLMNVMSDCQKAVKSLSITSSQLNEILKKDPNYLNKVVTNYNSGCVD